MKLDRLKEMRLSWSLYYAYLKNNWSDVWMYLLGIEKEKTKAMKRGIKIHEELELLPEIFIKFYLKEGTVIDFLKTEYKIERKEDNYSIVGVVDLFMKIGNVYYFVDYKTGDLNTNYFQQLYLYSYILFGDVDVDVEPKAVGVLVHVDDDLQFDKILERTLDNFNACVMASKFDQMYSDIMQAIHAGRLEDFADRHGLLTNELKEIINNKKLIYESQEK